MMFNKKKAIAIALTTVSLGIVATSASAALPGFYLGGQVGEGTTHQDKLNVLNFGSLNSSLGATSSTLSSSNSNGGLAGRLFAGYNFNPTYGLELGVTRFKTETGRQAYSATTGTGPVTINQKVTNRNTTVDLVLVSNVPMSSSFNLISKFGAAYVTAESKYQGTSSTASFTPTNTTTKEHKLLPTFTVGVGYDLTPNLVTDLSWQHVQKVGNTTNIHNSDFLGLGLSYYFG